MVLTGLKWHEAQAIEIEDPEFAHQFDFPSVGVLLFPLSFHQPSVTGG